MTDAEQETARENAALMEQLLTEPQSSSLMQWFIMLAVEKYCDTILSTGDGGLKHPLIPERDRKSWALEANEAMNRWQT